MKKRFLDKVEDNAAVRTWSEMTHVTQNSLQELKEICDQWNDEVRQLFYSNYGDLPYLLDMKVDKHLFWALAQFWNPAYNCFTFWKVDLVPTIEEYMDLLRCSKIQVDRAYSRAINVPTFLKKLMNITGMSDLKDIILACPDMKKRVDVFALSIYGLVVFPKALGHVDESFIGLFDRLDKRVIPVPTILAETFRSLNACRKAGKGIFIGCAQLLLAWFHSHFWKVDRVSYRVFSKNYSPLKEIVATPMRDDILEEKWMAILQNLQEKDIGCRAPWLLPDEILYRCGDFEWVHLLGIWGAIGYGPLLVLRQYRSRKFIPATQGIAECEFSYKGDSYKKKIREMSNAWNQTRRMKRLAVGPMTTPEYNEWWVKRINDNIPKLSQGNKLEKKIEQMEEENINLRLDMDVQKLEAEKLRKGKNKVNDDLDGLKTDYKKLRLSMRIAGLGKTSEQWQKILSENQKEKGKLKNRVAELKRSLRQYQNRDSAIELRTSLSRIEEMKKRIKELETALQNCEIRIEYFEANKDRHNEQLHYF
ncbi:hypothetical protein Gogos_019890 [Gossypium gossypioides]|uniref:DUF7745 domain-containing protein n=2 Tax=Gossypium gossypioides TaxID=34282 RepID=A0A7J9CZK2_GOSGO|nr:hypothetical protein [Gossypium gossypioides]